MKTEQSIVLRVERKTLQAEYTNVRNNYLELVEKLKGNRAEKLVIRNKIKELTKKIKEVEA
jgi:predicted nuclease with TOPRIM domain